MPIREYRKKPVVVEAWPVRELNQYAQHDWYALPQCIRDDYENPQGDGAWVFGALKETYSCFCGAEHGSNPPGSHCSKCGDRLTVSSRRGIYVPTLEGNLFADPDDMIIRGVKGEFYPCKPDIFAQTYEPVALDIDEMTEKTILQQEAKKRMYDTLKAHRKPIPPDLEEEFGN